MMGKMNDMVKLKNYGLSLSSGRTGGVISSSEMITRLGVESSHYRWAISELKRLYQELEKNRSSYMKLVIGEWEKVYSGVYGRNPSLDIFFEHVYLAIVVETILYLRFYHQRNGIMSFLGHLSLLGNDEFITNLVGWLEDNLIVNESAKIFHRTAEILSKYDLTAIYEDIFKGLYEEIIEQSHRHKLGEYYTPTWLVELILEQILSVWDREVPPKILDPACGSGSFLVQSAVNLKERFNLSSREVVNYISGFDINPIAVMVAKANLALLLNEPDLSMFQIFNRDALKDYELFDRETADLYDIIVGNPPWLVLRSIKNKDYQSFVKKEMLRYGLIHNGDTHLYTQLDISTLFFAKSVDRYLRKGGIIAFVMPRSVIGNTYQHKNFRKFKKPMVKLLKILDLEEVSPLFKMPACVLIGRKGSKNRYPVVMEKYSGVLTEGDMNLADTKPFLAVRTRKYSPPINGAKRSPYYERFKVGLSIFPRSFYFVNLQHVSDGKVKVKTSEDIYRIVKEPWRHKLDGKVEGEFIFFTLLPWKMVPFGYTDMHTVVLPIIPQGNGYILLDLEDMIKSEYIGLHDWFKTAQELWDKYKTDKARDRFPRLLDRLNYNNLIDHQRPQNRYVVLYNATGKNLTSCVVDKKNLPEILVDDTVFQPRGFIADVKTWLFETNSMMEAYYLASILNSDVLNRLIKPYQPKGLYGARAIHRRPLEFPIPEFDSENKTHVELASLGLDLHTEVNALIQNNFSKNAVRNYLKGKINEIDEIVVDLLQLKEVK